MLGIFGMPGYVADAKQDVPYWPSGLNTLAVLVLFTLYKDYPRYLRGWMVHHFQLPTYPTYRRRILVRGEMGRKLEFCSWHYQGVFDVNGTRLPCPR